MKNSIIILVYLFSVSLTLKLFIGYLNYLHVSIKILCSFPFYHPS